MTNGYNKVLLSPSGWTLRSEEKGDIDAIEKVTIAAFLNALHSDYTEQYIIRELRNSGA